MAIKPPHTFFSMKLPTRLFHCGIATVILSAGLLTSCGPKKASDPLASTGRTQRTENLLENLRHQADSAGYMYGHQDDTAYGIGWVGDSCRSDVQSVCNDFPAVIGFDLGHIELGDSCNLDGVPFDHMRQLIFAQYDRGGVITLSWHLDNPLSGGTSWINDSLRAQESRTVAEVLKDGEAHDRLVAYIDSAAAFIRSLQTPYGVQVPVIFRPWHEHTGSWFWWGKDFCTPQQYIALWKLTAERFKECGVTNALFAYSPDRTESAEAYMERYPGDEMVDIFGLDCYCFGNNEPATFENYVENVKRQLTYVCRLAKEHGKVAAFTETGYEGLPYEKWWTEALAPAIADLPVAYVLTWRNAHDKVGHFYAPYPGHTSVDDFTAFYNLPRTLFVHDVNGLYLQNSK